MYDEQEDTAQLEGCRQWSEEHKKKMTRKMQKKIRRVQQFGQMVVADVIYTKVNDTPYDFMQ